MNTRPPGALTQMLRIAVNNLAGGSSIVYGVFGLGFFVYLVGGGLDRAFFADTLPAPTLAPPDSLGLPHPGPAHPTGDDRGHGSYDSAAFLGNWVEASLALGATRFKRFATLSSPRPCRRCSRGSSFVVPGRWEVAPLMLVMW